MQVGLKVNPKNMTVKFVIQEWIANGNGQFFAYGNFQDIDTNTYLATYFPLINAYNYDTKQEIQTAAYAAIVNEGVNNLGYSTFTAVDIIDMAAYPVQVQSDWNQANSGALDYIKNKPTIPSSQVQPDWNSVSGLGQILNKPTIPSITRTTSTLSLSLVGTGATGTQISSTKDSTVRTTVSTSTTSTIGGPATSVVSLKMCATNDAIEGNWTTVATFESDQTVTLAIALQCVQVVKGQLTADVPAGYYVKLVNSGTGTHSEAFVSGQKTIYG